MSFVGRIVGLSVALFMAIAALALQAPPQAGGTQVDGAAPSKKQNVPFETIDSGILTISDLQEGDLAVVYYRSLNANNTWEYRLSFAGPAPIRVSGISRRPQTDTLVGEGAGVLTSEEIASIDHALQANRDIQGIRNSTPIIRIDVDWNHEGRLIRSEHIQHAALHLLERRYQTTFEDLVWRLGMLPTKGNNVEGAVSGSNDMPPADVIESPAVGISDLQEGDLAIVRYRSSGCKNSWEYRLSFVGPVPIQVSGTSGGPLEATLIGKRAGVLIAEEAVLLDRTLQANRELHGVRRSGERIRIDVDWIRGGRLVRSEHIRHGASHLMEQEYRRTFENLGQGLGMQLR